MTPNRHPLATGQPPPWAWGWGQDRYGVFTEIKVGEVVQRMRWIPPGSFWMGSPVEEEGRDSDEGPRHRVTLTQGFWLGDTPCTQAMWQQVMEENPSRFQSPKRPVEQVSWADCQLFFELLDALKPGIRSQLPTEAEWEYACRAGSQTSSWIGNLEILGFWNAPVLDSIAWYGGNSGVDFDLPGATRGTHKVGCNRPNPWGLFDMLGNVYEWCRDTWVWGRPYSGRDRVNPAANEGSDRVVRGGSWESDARSLRAAFRYGNDSDTRSSTLGFRILILAADAKEVS